MKKMRILLLLAMISTLTAQWKDLTLEDVFQRPSFFKVASLGHRKWLANSDEYLFFNLGPYSNINQNLLLESNIEPLSILKYNLATGDTTEFVSGDDFNYNGKILRVYDFTYQEDSKKILLKTDQVKIWRHSRSAIYYLYDMNNGSVKQVADGDRLRNVKFSPD